jgi:ribosomal protein S18 acetylase RimI-like enzyme
MSVPHHEIVVLPKHGQEGREELLQQCFDVRINVFHREQKFPLETEFDKFVLMFFGLCIYVNLETLTPTLSTPMHMCSMDRVGTHLLLRLLPSLEPIGTVRCYKTETATDRESYRLSRLCVLKEFRRYKFGSELVLALHECIKQAAKQAGSISVNVLAHSQIPAIPFYAK